MSTPKTNAPPVPNLEHLVKAKIGGTEDEGEIQQFFGITRKPGAAWVKSLEPGLDAGQKVLIAYIKEQNASMSDIVVPSETLQDEHVVRKDLTRAIFGPSDLDFLAQLATSLKAGEVVTINFEEIEDGKMSLKVVSRKPDQADDFLKPALAGNPASPVHGATLDTLDVIANTLRSKVRLAEGESGSIEEILNAVLAGRWSRRVAMLLPMNRDVNPHVLYSLLAQVRKQPWLGVHYETDTIIQYARNLLAAKFLASEAEWAFWHDSDNIAPFGDPHFFYDQDRLHADPTFLKPQFTSVLAVERLLKAGKTIVGGVYQKRAAGMDQPMIIQPHLNPSGNADKELVISLLRNGPQDKVVPVGWVATGIALVHRSVFEAIMQKFPQFAKPGRPFDFFGHDLNVSGEDAHFCELAKQAGHQSYLDLGLWAAHLGTQAFFPQRKLN